MLVFRNKKMTKSFLNFGYTEELVLKTRVKLIFQAFLRKNILPQILLTVLFVEQTERSGIRVNEARTFHELYT